MDIIQTWFNKLLLDNPDYSVLKQNPIAYFCAEFALADIMPIYSGGLGVLSGDTIREADELGIPLVGVGLLYKKGYFKQEIADDGTQVEVEQYLNPRAAGLSLVLNNEGNVYIESIPIEDRDVYFQTWHLKVGSIDMYFLDSDVDKNSDTDKVITHTLYGGDINTRILQEIILGIGGEKILYAQGIFPSIYHMNEGHSAFAALGITHHYMRNNNTDALSAFQEIKKKIVFTNHTLVPAGNDIFPIELVKKHLSKYTQEVSIPLDQFIEKGLSIDGKYFSMTIFALNLSFKVNAVSKMHYEKVKLLWPRYNLIPITNGINIKTWLHPLIFNKLEEIRIKNNLNKIEDCFDYLSKKDLWETHIAIKDLMFKEICNLTGHILDKNTLTITWAKRIAEYKRPDLIFLDIERFKSILNNIQRPIQIIISGKAHPKDETGKAILHNIITNIKKIDQPNKIIYIPNYSISIASLLVSGSDVWLNNPIKGYEASGTSGMKSGLNGSLQLTTKDGWADEVEWNDFGWTIDESDSSKSLYDQIENDIAPAFYKRENNIPQEWTDKMLKTMKIVVNQFSTKRMLKDYFNMMYLESLKAQK